MRNFFRVLRYARPYRGYAVLNVLFNLGSTVFHLASLLVFIPFLNLLFGQAPPPTARPDVGLSVEGLKRLPELFNWRMAAYIEEHGRMGGLVFICVVVALCFLLKNLLRYFALWAIGILRNRAVRDLRNEVYDKILDLPMRFHTGERKGNTIARITGDVQEVEFSIMNYIEMVFREPLTILLSLALMIGISWKLTLIALLLLPLSGLLIGRIGKSLRKEGLRAQQKAADLLSTVEETLTGMRVVKAFNGEEQMRRRFRRENEMLNRLNVFTLRRRDMASPLSEFLGALVMVVLVYLGGSLVIGQDATLSGGAFIGYIILFSQLLAPAKSFTTGYYWIRKGGASAERIFDLLAVENSVKERPDARPIATFADRVTFEGVRFAYDERPVLRTIDLELPKGRSVALVGTSGGGKSTLAGLLPRFHDVTGGSVRIDGIDVRDLRLKDLRALMGIVTQDSILFNDTVANNIAFGQPGVATADIERAARIANAHDFIMRLEQGYQTNIGDMGNRLSGGQKQRLAIARAVLKNPPILILDEATSALDTESERLVQDALFKMMEGRTSLVIAHRLSTIQHCDQICVVVDGAIVERGTHAQLHGAGGHYRRLCDMQAFA
ncbi:MAG: ABC transporter ATP-binding protein [Flavobacteriales bacterium]|nr:putative multidrug export ATP-binding/permease protein [Flavobacteriales bacterium]MCC6578111.1 ABC transporter ATP-binding protein [Flavobacteriales bacterium]NUQ14812.1 ABC transporter ATP-binding protein [Flavobacteriales bacterium]